MTGVFQVKFAVPPGFEISESNYESLLAWQTKKYELLKSGSTTLYVTRGTTFKIHCGESGASNDGNREEYVFVNFTTFIFG